MNNMFYFPKDVLSMSKFTSHKRCHILLSYIRGKFNIFMAV